jgi:SAM-dependent methyltransferase
MPDIKDVVREKYGKVALRVTAGDDTRCCGPGCCSPRAGAVDPITLGLDNQQSTEGLPAEAVLASLGCGNPTALVQLQPGEVVLDLDSGGGIDVLLFARRAGPTGKAYGLDMTDEMLGLAWENQRKAGVENVELLKGVIEHIPLPDASVDVASRTASPTSRPTSTRCSPRRSGSSSRAGGSPSRMSWRAVTCRRAREFLSGHGLDVDEIAPLVDGRFFSGFIRARKPASVAQPAKDVTGLASGASILGRLGRLRSSRFRA